MLIRTNVTNIGDPFVIYDGTHYYMYATSFTADGFEVRISDDLKNWENLGVCLDLSNSWCYNDYWAPEVIKHNGKYYMHYTSRRRLDDSLRIGVAVSEKPEGPFLDVYGGPMFDYGYAAIDGHVFIDDDKNYFYFSRDCSENVINGVHISQIYVSELSDDLTKLIGEPKLVLGPDQDYEDGSNPEWRWTEGPNMLKKDGVYYLNYSSNCFATSNYCVCLATSTDPVSGFVKSDKNPIIAFNMVEDDFSGPGHNAYFHDKDGKLMTAFHIHTDKNDPSQDRKAVICEAEISNGTIKVVL